MSDPTLELEEDEPIQLRRRPLAESELDITPMIDLTFLLLIFFLVTSVPDVQKKLDLPPARHGVAVNPREALIISVTGADDQAPTIYLGDGRAGPPITGTEAQQSAAIQEAVRAAVADGKTAVLIKAERGVLHREVARIGAAASSAATVRLNVAVMEAP